MSEDQRGKQSHSYIIVLMLINSKILACFGVSALINFLSFSIFCVTYI